MFPSFVTCCFSLVAFNILSWCLVFVSLISTRLAVFLLGFILYGTLFLLDLIDYFLFHVGDIFTYTLSKDFLLLLFPFFFWDPYNSKVGAFNILPDVSETILSSFHSVYFILLFRNYFHNFIFPLTDSFFCFRCSAIDSFQSIFNFSCLYVYFFNSSLLTVN